MGAAVRSPPPVNIYFGSSVSREHGVNSAIAVPVSKHHHLRHNNHLATALSAVIILSSSEGSHDSWASSGQGPAGRCSGTLAPDSWGLPARERSRAAV